VGAIQEDNSSPFDLSSLVEDAAPVTSSKDVTPDAEKSPVTRFDGGAFGISAEAEREMPYSTLPEGTDILVTRQPPLGVLDEGQGCPPFDVPLSS
jgi:hypothetical protein